MVPRSPDELGASLNDAVNRHDANQVQDILCECFATLQEEAVNCECFATLPEGFQGFGGHAPR